MVSFGSILIDYDVGDKNYLKLVLEIYLFLIYMRDTFWRKVWQYSLKHTWNKVELGSFQAILQE